MSASRRRFIQRLVCQISSNVARRVLVVTGCAKSTEFEIDRRTVDGYRTSEDARIAGQAHIRAIVAERSPRLCRGTCPSKTSRCTSVVLDDDLVEAVHTFTHLDEDGDPSVGWLVEGTISVHCVCVEIRRPNKPTPAIPVVAPAKRAARKRPTKGTAARRPTPPRKGT